MDEEEDEELPTQDMIRLVSERFSVVFNASLDRFDIEDSSFYWKTHAEYTKTP